MEKISISFDSLRYITTKATAVIANGVVLDLMF
jgi:hypothetical protein